MAYRSRNSGDSNNRLSDRDMLLDMLSTGKYMSHLYENAVMESSSSSMRDTFENFQQDEHQIAEEIFNIMQQEGWYSGSSGKISPSQMSTAQASGRFASMYGSRGETSQTGQSRGYSSNRSRIKTGSNTLID